MDDTRVIERIRRILGEQRCISEPAALAPHLTEWRGLYHGRTPLLVKPASTQQVSAVVAVCAETATPLVPQGGNTGLCGGAIPDESGRQILLSLADLDHIRQIDAAGYSITVEAGCILADVQRAAAEADRLFALSLAAEGSCQIGGNLSTNAGGTNVLRYGTAREQVLGLEVVLPEGQVWNGLRALRKDNTGYDLKQLFLGAEGTLGIITAAVLRLFPRPRGRATAWLALPDAAAALALLALARQESGDGVECFELVQRFGLDLVLRHIAATADPLGHAYEWYALLELGSLRSEAQARSDLERILERAMATGAVLDGVVAGSGRQRDSLWRLRESLSEAQKREGASIKHDVAVPLAAIPEFLRRADASVREALPGARPVAFGHVGDGNVHFNVCQPEGAERQAFLGEWERCNRIVNDLAVGLGGSFSAEHGIGRLKLAQLERYKGEVELSLMRAVKRLLDPADIMNPGKVIRTVDPAARSRAETEVRS